MLLVYIRFKSKLSRLESGFAGRPSWVICVNNDLNIYEHLRSFMNKHTKETCLITPYSYFDIPGLTRTDVDVLSYNRSNWKKGGYFASSAHASAELRLNIKTFQKSVTKLKKMGLWKYKNEVVEPRKYFTKAKSPDETLKPISPNGDSKSPIGDLKPLNGDIKSPIGGIKPLRGDYKNPVLPLKTEPLLDRLLDNKLNKIQDSKLDNAAGAANTSTSSLSLNNSEYFKETISAKLNLKDVKISGHLDSAYNKDTKIDPSKYDFSMYKVFGPDGVPIFQSDMVMANYHAAEAGMPRPYSNEDIASAPSSRHAFVNVEANKFWDELEKDYRPMVSRPSSSLGISEQFKDLFGS